MDEDLSDETWRRLRQEARRVAAEERGRQAEQWTDEAMETADAELLARIEQRLKGLSQAWAVHERPLVTRIPLIGPLLGRLGSRWGRFLLQHQVAFNAEIARALQELHQVQQVLTREQVDRGDDLFSRLDEAVLALEARIRDLEEEVERLRQQ